MRFVSKPTSSPHKFFFGLLVVVVVVVAAVALITLEAEAAEFAILADKVLAGLPLTIAGTGVISSFGEESPNPPPPLLEGSFELVSFDQRCAGLIVRLALNHKPHGLQSTCSRSSPKPSLGVTLTRRQVVDGSTVPQFRQKAYSPCQQ